MCVCVCVGVYVMLFVWRLANGFYYLRPRDQTQVSRLGVKGLCVLSRQSGSRLAISLSFVSLAGGWVYVLSLPTGTLSKIFAKGKY